MFVALLLAAAYGYGVGYTYHEPANTRLGALIGAALWPFWLIGGLWDCLMEPNT